MHGVLGHCLTLAFVVAVANGNAKAQLDKAENVFEGKPLTDWIKALEDKKPQARIQAATALGRMGFKARPAVPALIERFKDEDDMVCQAAAVAMGRIADVADLIRVLGDKDVRVRRWGAFAIGDLRRSLGGLHPADYSVGFTRDKLRNDLKAAVPALVEALQDKNDAVRAEVVSALGAIGPPAKEAVPKITALLEDPNKLIRRTAALALWWIDSQAKVAVPILIEGLEDKGADLIDRQACVYVLGEIGAQAEAAVPALIGLLRGIQKSTRTETSVELSQNAAEALGRLGEPAVPALTTQLRDKDPDIRKNAAWALWRMGPKAKAAVPALCEMSKDGNASVRLFAVAALGKIGPAAGGAVPALIERLQDPDGKIRVKASWALGSIGSAAKDAVPGLIATLKDKEKEARESATWALGKIGQGAKAAIPALIETAKMDKEHGLAAEALGRIGAEAKAAVPTLVAMLDQSPAQARIRIALAHWRITGHEETAVKVLTAALTGEQSADRCAAADALGEMGPKAKAAVPALIAMAKKKTGDDHFLDLEAARRALKKIDPQAAQSLGGRK
jgi:HEAT repeat protein